MSRRVVQLQQEQTSPNQECRIKSTPEKCILNIEIVLALNCQYHPSTSSSQTFSQTCIKNFISVNCWVIWDLTLIWKFFLFSIMQFFVNILGRGICVANKCRRPGPVRCREIGESCEIKFLLEYLYSARVFFDSERVFFHTLSVSTKIN